MMRTNYYFYCLIVNVFFFSATTYSQNFDETWKEFLENNKVSNMSELIRPDKAYDIQNYSKYLLMNANSSFCQSEMEEAEKLMAEIEEIGTEVYESIPGFVDKKSDLDAKIEAYYSIDVIWNEFLETKIVVLDDLEAVKAVKTTCEKRTLAKYSYMLAHYHLCLEEVSKAKNIFENRTLRLTEKTSLRVRDVKGLTPEVRNMKSLFQNMPKLDAAWETCIETGVSPGFDMELPLFLCYPIPNMKELVLKGLFDVCSSGPEMLDKINKLQADSGVVPRGELARKVEELEAAIEEKEANLSDLNKAWEAFVPDNKVKHEGQYGYDYCTNEPLIRAYIMDGFTFVCDMAEGALQKIDSLKKLEVRRLDKVTRTKIHELEELDQLYKLNGVEIERKWDEFVSQGDTLLDDYESTDQYCDLIHQVKDWTMKGLSGTCEEGLPYLEQIEAFNQTFEFKFYEELECRVQKLRIKIWDCRYEAMLELAKVESPDAYEERLKELMEEYKMGERPEACSLLEE